MRSGRLFVERPRDRNVITVWVEHGEIAMAPRPVANRRAGDHAAAEQTIEQRVDVVAAFEEERESHPRPPWILWRARVRPAEHDDRFVHFNAGQIQRARLVS